MQIKLHISLIDSINVQAGIVSSMTAALKGPTEVMPPGFGLLRIQEAGTSTHELIYEQDYFPQPVRLYSESDPVVDASMLRPAIRNGKVDFKFYGNRVPLTADHARCWFGHILLQEIQKGSLGHVELIVQRYEDFLELQSLDIANPRKHGVQPTWRWDVWLPASNKDNASDKKANSDPRSHRAVGVVMHISATHGIRIELESSQEALDDRTAVFRILRQYCDEDIGNARWHPIPESPASVSKIVDRSCTEQVKRNRILGVKLPETGLHTLHRSLSEWKQAENCLVHAIAQAQMGVLACEGTGAREASQDDGLRALLQCCSEVRDALDFASRAWLKLRPEWSTPAAEILEALLDLLIRHEDAGLLRDGITMVNSICDLGIALPGNFILAEEKVGDRLQS